MVDLNKTITPRKLENPVETAYAAYRRIDTAAPGFSKLTIVQRAAWAAATVELLQYHRRHATESGEVVSKMTPAEAVEATNPDTTPAPIVETPAPIVETPATATPKK